MITDWIEAIRPRTLPVSAAGVIAAMALSIMEGRLAIVPALLCLLFAVLAQVVSNFANEYYDYVAGTDKKGREGPRRGVTEGTISPTAMRNATFGTLAVACLVGLCLIPYGGWWLIGVGIAIAVFALAYSAGPYPLSRHGLGDVAVLVFFGLVPVNFTFYLMTGEWTLNALLLSVAIGLLGMNVLIVNNYRDADDDRSVGKHTTVVLLGRKTMSTVYAVGGIVAVALLAVILGSRGHWLLLAIAVVPYLLLHIATWRRLCSLNGRALHAVLGATARNMLILSALFLVVCIVAAP